MSLISIYTDGSCYPKEKKGTWATLIIIENQQTMLTGQEINTNHNRMELTAVIKALEYVYEKEIAFSKIDVYSDSQYVINIPERKTKLNASNFCSKKGREIQNTDLIKLLLETIQSQEINLIKVKAHQKKGLEPNYNRVVDKLARKNLRTINTI
jgi:ribonuclease HI